MVGRSIVRAKTITEDVIRSGRKEIFGILKSIKERRFEGNRGLAIKNSAYQFATNVVGKGGSLLFTIIVARLLMPELYGLYSLALSTIIVFASFADLGLGSTIVRFVANSLNNGREKKVKAYFDYLFRIKVILSIIISLLLLIFAKIIANNYYNKPIFYALLAGSLYILSQGIMTVFDSLFQSVNNFKRSFTKEIIFQTLRIIVIPLTILFSMSRYSNEVISFSIILGLSICYFISLIYIYLQAKKRIPFLRMEKTRLDKKERKKINKFWILLSTTILSGIFLGYVDTIMLGRFVSAEYIGYYQAALNLIGSIFPLIPIAAVLLPIFSRLKGKELERGFKRSVRFTIFVSIVFFLITVLLANIVIIIIYGRNYITSTDVLRILAINIFIIPVSSLYDTYFITVGKPQIMAKYLILSTILNIVLNYVLIVNLLRYSQHLAIVGSAVAVVISRAFYLTMQVIKRK